MASVGEAELAAVRAGAGGPVYRVAIATQGAAQRPEHHLVCCRRTNGIRVGCRWQTRLRGEGLSGL